MVDQDAKKGSGGEMVRLYTRQNDKTLTRGKKTLYKTENCTYNVIEMNMRNDVSRENAPQKGSPKMQVERKQVLREDETFRQKDRMLTAL